MLQLFSYRHTVPYSLLFIGTALLAKDKKNGQLVVVKTIPTKKKSELAEAKAEAEVC